MDPRHDEVFSYDPSPIRYPVPPALAPLDLGDDEPDERDEAGAEQTVFDPLMYERGVEAVTAPEDSEPGEDAGEAELVATEVPPPVPDTVADPVPSPIAERVRGALGLVLVVMIAAVALAAVIGATVAALAFAARRLAGG